MSSLESRIQNPKSTNLLKTDPNLSIKIPVQIPSDESDPDAPSSPFELPSI